MPYWVNDNASVYLLRQVFTKEEVESILSTKIGAIRVAIAMFESKIASLLYHLLSGQVASELGYTRAQQVVAALRPHNGENHT